MLQEIVIPEMTFFPPATIIDAVDFFKQVCRVDDKPGASPIQRGLNFTVSLPQVPLAGGDQQAADPFAVGAVTNGIVPKIPAISVRNISLFDAIQLVCDVTDMTLHIRGEGRVLLEPKGWSLDEDWATRSFTIPQALADCLFSSRADQASDDDPNKVWQTFFEQLGVTGPECAEFQYLSAIGKLRVTNTPENLAAIEVVLDQFALRMIEVEMQIHAFRAKDIERLRLAGGVSVESLMAMRRQGKAKSVATATALTKSGQEVVVKAVQEVLYPTELYTGVSEAGSNVTSRSAANALMPCNFEMRETGMTLNVVPEVTHGGTLINLMLNPAWVTLEGWESFPADLAAGWAHKTLTLRQPVFGVTSFQTQATVADGGTVLLGSCSTPDGEWVHVGFLTARLRNVQTRLSGKRIDKAAGERSGGRADKAKAQGEESCSAVAKKMRDTIITEMTFRPPSTIIDAVRFFTEASVEYDKTGVPEAQRGLSFVLKLPANAVAPVIPAVSARFINLYDALKLVSDVTGMKFRIGDGIVWILPMIEPCDELITRIYPMLPPLCDRMIGADSSREGDDDRQGWKAYFAQLGVNWPEGSAVSYVVSIGLLRVTNTPENLDVFEQVLEDLNVCPRMVEVEMQIHAFRPEDIERLRLSGGMSVDTLTALRKKGKARPVASATVLTQSGQEAVMKSVREMFYPTELDCGQMGSISTSGAGAGALMPCLFEMREVGMILQVVPEIAAMEHAQINVMLNPRWVTLDRWETYPAALAVGWTHKRLSFRQPVFGVTRFQTQVTVEDGGTVLLGSRSTPDGKWVHVGFLTAKRVDVQAGPSGCRP
jgi:type II secretory pathway component GspD/PulD (secretin)